MPEPRDEWAELRLWSAALSQAVEDAGPRDDYVAASAWRWLMSASTAPGSFLWITSLFDLRPESVRAALKARGRR